MMSSMSTRALLLFAHGSSDPAWAAPFERIREEIAARQPNIPVALAFLERMVPSFAEGIAVLVAAGANDITVAPLFLAPGGHVKKDLPALAREAETVHAISIRVLPSLGESPEMIDAIAQWAIAQGI